MKKTTKIYKDIPAGYPLCLHNDCAVADSCLRQLAFLRHGELDTFLKLINPSKYTKQSDCPHYVSSQPVRFAKGFVNFKKRMYPDQYDKFMTLLICHFGRNQYFKRRRGEIVLPPEEQEVIQVALEKAGVTQPMEFDEYIEASTGYPNQSKLSSKAVTAIRYSSTSQLKLQYQLAYTKKSTGLRI